MERIPTMLNIFYTYLLLLHACCPPNDKQPMPKLYKLNALNLKKNPYFLGYFCKRRQSVYPMWFLKCSKKCNIIT